MTTDSFRKTHLPYYLRREPDGSYVVLNRLHKPIGTNDFKGAENHLVYIKFKEGQLTPKKAAQISCHGLENLGQIALYHDHCIPTRSAKNMKDYAKRLRLIDRLRLEPATEIQRQEGE